MRKLKPANSQDCNGTVIVSWLPHTRHILFYFVLPTTLRLLGPGEFKILFRGHMVTQQDFGSGCDFFLSGVWSGLQPMALEEGNRCQPSDCNFQLLA